MKYWKDSEIQKIDCEEGQGALPYNHPASKVTKMLSTGEVTIMEIEIIPNTAEIRNHIDWNTFETEHTLCVKMERRQWRADGRYYEEWQWVPLQLLGYKEEPCSSKSFDEAMKII